MGINIILTIRGLFNSFHRNTHKDRYRKIEDILSMLEEIFGHTGWEHVESKILHADYVKRMYHINVKAGNANCSVSLLILYTHSRIKLHISISPIMKPSKFYTLKEYVDRLKSQLKIDFYQLNRTI